MSLISKSARVWANHSRLTLPIAFTTPKINSVSPVKCPGLNTLVVG